ncbi:MAG: hypothetical protein SFV19_13640 [Rhodospirillaceae bacterium]|nr:hypothetical protein [Rhodospirillaceae bacterium]
MISSGSKTLAECIDTIEASYEFMLAYAAQGRDDEATGTSPSIRQVLSALQSALNGLSAQVKSELGPHAGQLSEFITLIQNDARRAATVVGAALAAPIIGSQLIDNLNASVHVRTALTNVFLIDELTKSFRRAGPT